ncbi:MAG: hypothetical protein P8X55_02555 [Desulfosarcinaceae bacterium]
MSFPIAMIPYANMAPYRELGAPAGCTFVDLVPRQSIDALMGKKVWAAAVPVGGLAMLGERVRFLGKFGIAAKSRVMSVMFFSDRPFDEIRHPLTLSLTTESASSVRLLYLLLGYRQGFEAMPLRPGKSLEQANGTLKIGDTALRWVWELERKGSVQGYTHVTDLADRWFSRHGLPFVFARWVIRRDAPRSLNDRFQDWLAQFKIREQQLIEQAVPGEAERLGLPRRRVDEYLHVIRRCLNPEDEAGQALFRSEFVHFARDPLFAEETREPGGPDAKDHINGDERG